MPWHAVCENGHPIWDSGDKDTEAEAKEAGKQHDDDRHGGTPSAIVLKD